MKSHVPVSPASSAQYRLLAYTTIAVCVGLTYLNSLTVPFVFDDLTTVQTNESIRSLWPLSRPLTPPGGGGQTFEGRPIFNLSLAVNYTVSGLDPFSYHLANILIHALAALVFFGLLRRTLELPSLPKPLAANATPIAFAASMLWALHPLQTASISYVSRRVEALVGLLYLLTLYSLLRGASSPTRRQAWFAFGAVSCAVGMATKEVMVSAPLIAFLYDRSFLAGSFAEAWRRRWGFYSTLAATWILLAILVASSGNRGGSAGFGTELSPAAYALSQGHAILLYLRLALWPAPLVFDYGVQLPDANGWQFLQAGIVLCLFGATIWTLYRRPRSGFLGIAFFAILAPSSSIVPIATQPIAEHRMYLSLACLSIGLVLLAYRAAGRQILPCIVVVSLGLGGLSAVRNTDYRNAASLWADTVAKRPNNARAHDSLGSALAYQGKFGEAIPHFERAINLEPNRYSVQANLASSLLETGEYERALTNFEAAIAATPSPLPQTLYSYALALQQVGRLADSEAALRETIQLAPDHFAARMALGSLLSASRRVDEAADHFRKAAEIDPTSESASTNYGNALLMSGKIDDAIKAYDRSLELNSGSAPAHTNLGIAYLIQRNIALARDSFHAALRADSNYEPALQQLSRLPPK